MPSEITMPQLSDTMTEGTIVKWLFKEGDAVKANQPIAEVETDKATMEMETFEGGTLAKIVAQVGEKVPVGGVIGIVAKAGEKLEATAKPAAAAAGKTMPERIPPAKTAKPDRAEAGEAEGASQDAHGANAQAAASATIAATSERSSSGWDTHNKGSNGDRIVVSPLARRVAADLGVNLVGVKGSGPNGRIVQADVVAAKNSGSSAGSGMKPSAPTPQRVASGQTEKVVLNKMRQTIALRLQQSKQNIPHFYETIDIDMTSATSLRKKLVEMYEKKEGVRVSIGDIVAKAVAATLKAVPQMNATFDDKTSTVTRFGDVNLGMAVALPDGLIVPVLRSIDQMSFKEIRVKSADLVERARAQKLKREEMSGATFTVSNLGLMGIREFSAIVNPPEVGILAIGESADRAVVRDGQIVVKNMMTVTLSCDHRVIDGAVAAKFLTTLKGFLEEPALMFI